MLKAEPSVHPPEKPLFDLVQSIQAKLTAGADPDEWVMLLVQLESAIAGMQEGNARELLTRASARARATAATLLMPVVYVAVARAARWNSHALLAGEIERAEAAWLWGLTIALAVERPKTLVEDVQREFWIAAFLHRPFGQDPDYWQRYLVKRGIMRPESVTENLAIDKSIWRRISPVPFQRTLGTVSPEVAGMLLDRLERSSKLELEDAHFIVKYLPPQAQELHVRTAGWILNPDLPPELRRFALEVLGNIDRSKATTLAQTAIQQNPSDPALTRCFASWVLSNAPEQGVELLWSAYKHQALHGQDDASLVRTITACPTSGAIGVAGELLRVDAHDKAQACALQGLRDGAWSEKPALASQREALFLQALTSRHPSTRSQAAMGLGSLAADAQTSNGAAVVSRLEELARIDPSPRVREAAASALRVAQEALPK
ncbi:MAG: HEAT repeat domain-containing protein [Planctomycetes bacterium]|nr:HEAT repeat domain-containing protein [Planctomycetota bacterium]